MEAGAVLTLWISLWALHNKCGSPLFLSWSSVSTCWPFWGSLLSILTGPLLPFVFSHTDTNTMLAADLYPSTCILGIMGLPCHHFFFFYVVHKFLILLLSCPVFKDCWGPNDYMVSLLPFSQNWRSIFLFPLWLGKLLTESLKVVFLPMNQQKV